MYVNIHEVFVSLYRSISHAYTISSIYLENHIDDMVYACEIDRYKLTNTSCIFTYIYA